MKMTKEMAEAKNCPHYNRDEPCPTCKVDVFYVKKPDLCVDCERRRMAIYNLMKKNRGKTYSGSDILKILEDGGGSFTLDLQIRRQGNDRLSIAVLVHKDTGLEYWPIDAFDWGTDKPDDYLDWEAQIREDWGFAELEAEDD